MRFFAKISAKLLEIGKKIRIFASAYYILSILFTAEYSVEDMLTYYLLKGNFALRMVVADESRKSIMP